MKTEILFCLLLATFFVSCSSLNISEINNPANKVEIEALNLRMGYDIYNLRIDLYRNTTTEMETTPSGGANGANTTQTRTVNVPYHYLGVYLYDGIFLDINNNLTINVVDLIGKNNATNFQIQKKMKSRFPYYIVTKRNNHVILETKGLIGKKVTNISLSDNAISIKGGFLEGKQDILIKQDKIVYDPHGIFSKLIKTELVRTENGFKVPGFWRDSEFKQTEKNTIELGKHLLVKNYGDKIEFVFTGFFGKNRVLTLLKLKDGYIFHDKKNRGIRISLKENEIFVEQNGKLISHFEITD